ncbi:AfsR/SARP family transcriptional regulator, partial [Streptomyces sp. WAC06614]|uniref:AfsR/SARP family transcriptional regulator n=1 Tax=Streptomyces sp. WAC06614 TaxID=2487416 RepID=UPI00163B746E
MEVVLLGPVELRADDGTPLRTGGAKRRAVLGALALSLGRVVPVARLLDLVWDGAPPPSAKAALQGHVAGLRALLDGTSLHLVTRDPGYALLGDRARVDVHRVRDLLAEAEGAAEPGTDEAAVDLLRHALALWRGPALADCGSETLRATAEPGLEGLRLKIVERLAERLLRVGRGGSALAELADALRAHPLRETLAALLMRCLHQEGRQADALGHYHRIRVRLAEELGVDPGPRLQEALATVLGTT